MGLASNRASHFHASHNSFSCKWSPWSISTFTNGTQQPQLISINLIMWIYETEDSLIIELFELINKTCPWPNILVHHMFDLAPTLIINLLLISLLISTFYPNIFHKLKHKCIITCTIGLAQIVSYLGIQTQALRWPFTHIN